MTKVGAVAQKTIEEIQFERATKEMGEVLDLLEQVFEDLGQSNNVGLVAELKKVRDAAFTLYNQLIGLAPSINPQS